MRGLCSASSPMFSLAASKNIPRAGWALRNFCEKVTLCFSSRSHIRSQAASTCSRETGFTETKPNQSELWYSWQCFQIEADQIAARVAGIEQTVGQNGGRPTETGEDLRAGERFELDGRRFAEQQLAFLRENQEFIVGANE